MEGREGIRSPGQKGHHIPVQNSQRSLKLSEKNPLLSQQGMTCESSRVASGALPLCHSLTPSFLPRPCLERSASALHLALSWALWSPGGGSYRMDAAPTHKGRGIAFKAEETTCAEDGKGPLEPWRIKFKKRRSRGQGRGCVFLGPTLHPH